MRQACRKTRMAKRDFIVINFIEIALRHECSSVNLLNTYRVPFYKNTYGGLVLKKFTKITTNEINPEFFKLIVVFVTLTIPVPIPDEEKKLT